MFKYLIILLSFVHIQYESIKLYMHNNKCHNCVLEYVVNIPEDYKLIRVEGGHGEVCHVFSYTNGSVFYIGNSDIANIHNEHCFKKAMMEKYNWEYDQPLVDNDFLYEEITSGRLDLPLQWELNGKLFNNRSWREIQTYDYIIGYKNVKSKDVSTFDYAINSFIEMYSGEKLRIDRL